MGARFDSVEALLASVDAALAGPWPAGVAHAAVFDADHTLWNGDIGDHAFLAAGAEGFLLPETWRGPVRSWAEAWGLELSVDPAFGVRQLLEASASGVLEATARARGLDGGAWRSALYSMQAWAYAGRTRAEVHAFGEQLFARGFEAHLYADLRRVVEGLTARGVRVCIASASHGALVLPGGTRLGLGAEWVWGMEPHLDDAGRTLPRLRQDTYGAAKATTTQALLGGARPAWAFGDSVLHTDRELLACAVHGVAVAAKGAHRDAALASPSLRLFDPTE
ncbi:MAG: hypothetical protein RL653_4419 [Pseudomonadota bacterium]